MMDKRSFFIERTKKSLRASFQQRDRVLITVTKTLEDVVKVLNVLGERLEDWYYLYFPELKIKDREKLARLIAVLDKNNPSRDAVVAVVGAEKADEILSLARHSIGADFSKKDLEECREYAESYLKVAEEKRRLEGYQELLCKEVAPNATFFAGASLTAKLIAHVGSLKKLALLPASAVQILGAEKALFKHLKNKKIPSPKHGLIFLHPKISSVPKKMRGKVARAFASKLSYALRADAFGGRFIADKLKKEFEERFKEIVKE